MQQAFKLKFLLYNTALKSLKLRRGASNAKHHYRLISTKSNQTIDVNTEQNPGRSTDDYVPSHTAA